jgi:hypothetical protein
MRKRNLMFACLIASSLLIFNIQFALAHETITAGDYQIEVGWLSEPPIAGQMNGIIVNITKGADEEPVEGISNLVVSVTYGGQSKALLLQPLGEDTPGQFVAPVLPSIPGQYTVQLSGKLGDTDMSTKVEPEKVQAPEVIQFPLVEVSSQNNGLGLPGWLALLGILLGFVGIGIGTLAYRKNR